MLVLIKMDLIEITLENFSILVTLMLNVKGIKNFLRKNVYFFIDHNYLLNIAGILKKNIFSLVKYLILFLHIYF